MKNAQSSFKQIVIASAAIFIVAFGVRLLSWHDTRREVGKIQTVVAADYQSAARLLRQEGVRGALSSSGPLADPNMLGHPPGYPVVIAMLWAVIGESNTSIQLFQIICDALAAVLIFLIAAELFPFAVGVISGALVAFAPQFSWNSVLLLPDTLAVLPLILAIYFLTRGWKNPRFLWLVLAGVSVGLSCWLRANALFMAPFLAVAILRMFDHKRRLQFTGAFLAGALLVIAPLTLRNWIVFYHFIPVSLGAGHTLLEGISDYDHTGKHGIPNTDMGIMKMEAEQHSRPDYYSTLFVPDGIRRDRMRVARSLDIIRQHPGWFLLVMMQRAGLMLRLERARRVSTDPPVRQYGELSDSKRVWMPRMEVLHTDMERFASVAVELRDEGRTLQIRSSSPGNTLLLRSTPIARKNSHEYVYRMKAVVDKGRVALQVTSSDGGKVLSSAIVEEVEVKEGQPAPVQVVDLPFLSGSDGAIRLAVHNQSTSETSVVNVRSVELFELSSASFVWTRPLRWVVASIQKFFITAVMLPLVLAGLVILIRRRAWRVLLLLSSVPVYYFCFQSLLHTEYRYVLAVHYFLFVLVSVAVYELFRLMPGLIGRDSAQKASSE